MSMFTFFSKSKPKDNQNEFQSKLYDEKGFYGAFVKDLRQAKEEVIIESPFITSGRMRKLFPVFEELIRRDVKVYVVTRDPRQHDYEWAEQAEAEIQRFAVLGVQVIMASNSHHRKLAIIDREVLWEGSLNILSQTNSREFMRRIWGRKYAQELFDFLDLKRLFA